MEFGSPANSLIYERGTRVTRRHAPLNGVHARANIGGARVVRRNSNSELFDGHSLSRVRNSRSKLAFTRVFTCHETGDLLALDRSDPAMRVKFARKIEREREREREINLILQQERRARCRSEASRRFATRILKATRKISMKFLFGKAVVTFHTILRRIVSLRTWQCVSQSEESKYCTSVRLANVNSSVVFKNNLLFLISF